MARLPASARLLAWSVLIGLHAPAANALAEDVDSLAAARAEFRQGMSQPRATGPDSEALRGYPLYPYLQAARLRQALADVHGDDATQLDAPVLAFLATSDNPLVSHDLRRDWLTSLALRQQWPQYLAQYQDAVATPELRCQQLLARIALNRTKALIPDLTQTWLTGQVLPSSCTAGFDWLKANEGLPPSLVDRRARLALQAGNARLALLLAGGLPAGLAAPLRQWASLIETPRAEIELLIAAPARPVEPAALLDGWTRLSRIDADAAAADFMPLMASRRLDTLADRAPFIRAVGLAYAWDRRSEAIDWLQQLGADLAADDMLRDWKLRAALWSGDWSAARQAIADVPAEVVSDQPRWQYWQARTDEMDGRMEEAITRYSRVASGDGYYPALAAARLNQPYRPHPEPVALDAVQQARLGSLPGFVRAHELWLCALENQAGQEWLAALDGLDPAARLQAIGLAARWGWHAQVVATATKQGVFSDYELLYPRPFDGAVKAAAAANGLPEDLIYAVIRQESLFDANVVSHANALGLMQLVLPTARAIARRTQQPIPDREALFDPATNISLGAAELRGDLDRFGGQPPLGIAAYNAGPGAANRWLPPAPMDSDIWIENIPYNETRSYVQRVLWHSLVFAWRRSGEAQRPTPWLAKVSASRSGAPEADQDPSPPAAVR